MALSEKGRGFLHEYLKSEAKATDEQIDRFLRDPRAVEKIQKMLQSTWRDFHSRNPKLHKFTNIEILPHELAQRTSPPIQPQRTGPPQQPTTRPIAPTISLAPAPTSAPKQPVSPIVNPTPANQAASSPQSSVPQNPTPISPQPQHTLLFRLANGMAGIEYRNKIELVTPYAPTYSVKDIEVPPQLGLISDAALMELSGSPTKDGDFKIVVWYSVGDSPLAQSAIVNLVINPDPKSLWKDLPSKQDDPYWKPDLDSLTIQGEGVLMAAASKRGRSHAHVGSFRDDDFYLAHIPEGQWHIAIVSDGAGSAKYSRRGSQIICNEGGTRLRELLSGADGQGLIQAVEALNSAQTSGTETDGLERQIKNMLYTTIGYTAHHVTKLLQDECKTRVDLGGTFKDYSSTAIIGLFRRFSFGVLCAAYWVGDGAVGILRNDSVPILLGEADSGEYSGQTRFVDPAEVTQEALFKRIRFAVVNDFKAMLLMTDGVSDPFFETEANLANPAKWAALWNDVESKANLVQRDSEVGVRMVTWLDFWSTGNHDDRTIAAIY